MSNYPSDAPLPLFQISGVSGYVAEYVPLSSGPRILVRFEAQITNYVEVRDWLSSNQAMDRLVFRLSHGEMISFNENGVIRMEFADVDFRAETFGKWVRLEFTGLVDPVFSFSSPVYFCDVYVPVYEALPVGVWTDLQFKTGGQPVSGFVALAAICGLGGLAYYLYRRRKK